LGTCRDDYDDADNLLLLLFLSLINTYVRADWTAYWPVTIAAQAYTDNITQREEKRTSNAASAVKRHS
jgi:hypothetical protein